MSAVLFFIAAIGVIAGAVGVVVLRNPFYSVLALVAHLVSLAVLFLLLRAEFLAAVQVVIYAGAVMVLYVFVVAYVGGEGDSIGERLRGPSRSGEHGPIGSRPASRRGDPRRGAARGAADRAARHGPGGDRRLRRRLCSGAAGVRHTGLYRQAAADPLPARVRARLLPAADRGRRRGRARATSRRARGRGRAPRARPARLAAPAPHRHDGRGRRQGDGAPGGRLEDDRQPGRSRLEIGSGHSS